MPTLVASIPALRLLKDGLEQNKELDVLALGVDPRPRAAGAPALPTGGANADVRELAPGVVGALEGTGAFVVASQTFHRVRAEAPLPLVGSGIVLYPNLDPGGMLGLHVFVVESQSGARQVGDSLGALLGGGPVKQALVALRAAAVVTQPLAAGLLTAVAAGLPAALKAQRDRVWFTMAYTGFDFDGYAMPPGESVHDFVQANDKVELTLRLRRVG